MAMQLNPIQQYQNKHKGIRTMTFFSESMFKLLTEYKRVLKRYFKPEDRLIKIDDLELQRKLLKYADDIGLFHKAHRVLNDIEQWNNTTTNSPTEYSGIEEFYQHLKNQVNEYRLENGKLVNITQQASRAIVDAVQLMGLPEPQLTQPIAKKLDQCIYIVAKFGSKEQQDVFIKALKTQKNRLVNFFLPLLNNFERYLDLPEKKVAEG